jgi:uncharacterized iron-regulated protein
MEQIRPEQAGLLKLFMSGPNRTAERLGPAIGWKGSGWPDWSMYRPIAEVALDAGLAIYGGDSSREMNRKIGKQGFSSLPRAEVEELGLNYPLGKSMDNALLDELVISHCKTLPRKRLKPMALVQRYRDAHLARAKRKAAAKGEGVVLIAGNGHVRTDRAAPWYLRGDGVASVSVMIVEASADAESPIDLAPFSPSAQPAADYIWVTPGVEREDPCVKLRKRFSRAHGRKGGGSKKNKRKSPHK